MIFYVHRTDANGWLYLEAATTDQNTGTAWGGYQASVGGTGNGR